MMMFLSLFVIAALGRSTGLTSTGRKISFASCSNVANCEFHWIRPFCDHTGVKECRFCKKGYELSNNQCTACSKVENCVKNSSMCRGGTILCHYCKAGFYLGGGAKQCKPYKNVENCATHGDGHLRTFKECTSCKSGYELDDFSNTCQPKEDSSDEPDVVDELPATPWPAMKECSGGQKFMECGTACPKICGKPEPTVCTRQCAVNVCQCPMEMWFDPVEKECVDQCPTDAATCKGAGEYCGFTWASWGRRRFGLTDIAKRACAKECCPGMQTLCEWGLCRCVAVPVARG